MSARNLIVNADDFGQSAGVNLGIIQAHEKGIVTSASLMVRYPAATEAALYAKSHSSLGVGLHVDLGEWMYRDGDWEPLYEVVALNNTKKVEKEVLHQLEAFLQIMGRKPTHIDSHQHIHQRELLLPIFINVARELNITLRGSSGHVAYCGDFYGQYSDGSPFHEAISVEGLQQIIMTLSEGYTEMACHPGLDNDIQTMYKTEREKEVATLCNKSIKEYIDRYNIELCTFMGIPFI